MRATSPAALALLLALVLAPPARAEISVDSSEFEVYVFAGVDKNGDGVILDDEADIEEVARSGVLSFPETLRASSRASQGSASQTSSVSATATRVSLDSNASCGGISEQGDEGTQGYGNALLFLSFTLTVPSRLSVTGSIDASEGGRVALSAGSGSIAYEVIDATQDVAGSVILDPGTHFVAVTCSADTYFDVGFGGHETAS